MNREKDVQDNWSLIKKCSELLVENQLLKEKLKRYAAMSIENESFDEEASPPEAEPLSKEEIVALWLDGAVFRGKGNAIYKPIMMQLSGDMFDRNAVVWATYEYFIFNFNEYRLPGGEWLPLTKCGNKLN